MKPYYQDKYATIFLGDCLELLPEMPKVDLVLTDPPYNVGYHYESYYDKMTESDYFNMLVNTISVPSVVIHYPEELFKFSLKLGLTPDKVVSWIYNCNTPRQWRGIVWFGCSPEFSLEGQDYMNPNDKRIKRRINNGYKARLYDWWNIPQVKNISSEKTNHPCQIPTTLMFRILKITPMAKTILDPFGGSCTTAVAAKQLNRKCIIIEIEEKYCEIGAKRLSQEVLDLAE